jgi:hypothetical protein
MSFINRRKLGPFDPGLQYPDRVRVAAVQAQVGYPEVVGLPQIERSYGIRVPPIT